MTCFIFVIVKLDNFHTQNKLYYVFLQHSLAHCHKKQFLSNATQFLVYTVDSYVIRDTNFHRFKEMFWLIFITGLCGLYTSLGITPKYNPWLIMNSLIFPISKFLYDQYLFPWFSLLVSSHVKSDNLHCTILWPNIYLDFSSK